MKESDYQSCSCESCAILREEDKIDKEKRKDVERMLSEAIQEGKINPEEYVVLFNLNRLGWLVGVTREFDGHNRWYTFELKNVHK